MENRGNSIIRKKAMDFSVRMYHLNDYLIKQRKYAIADQVFRSGTSIGANVSEAIRAESESDFVHKYSIAMKEAEETLYWLELIYKVDLLDEKLYHSLQNDCEELIKLGTSTILTMLRKIKAATADNHNL
ncbi:MAG: four helix bundle protein [Prevotella sp.]|nr:four helix bundle protein [Prevotella sp.]